MGYFYRLRRSPSSQTLGKIPITWEPHKDSECICTKDGIGRPSKKRKPVDDEDGSNTESGEDDEDEAEKDSCNMFRNISENLHNLDKELALVLCKNICSQFGLLFIDPEKKYSSVRAIDRQLVLKLVEIIFSLEREQLIVDSGELSHRNISDLLKGNPESWLLSRNLVLKSAVNALSDSRTNAITKVIAVDHMHNLAKPNFISPILFGANLVMYSIARSKMAADIYEKLHPGGQYKLMKSWLNGLTMEIPAMPDNDILTAIDDDQVILKKWTGWIIVLK